LILIVSGNDWYRPNSSGFSDQCFYLVSFITLPFLVFLNRTQGQNDLKTIRVVGVTGLEPMNPKESIYSAPQLPLCDTPNLVFSLPLNNHIAIPVLLPDAYQLHVGAITTL
jgi:hypothetical protein